MKGVEAQTLTVWRQASGYRVPQLFYLNKMDRADADVAACVRSIEEKLQAEPLQLHIPVKLDGRLIGKSIIREINEEMHAWFCIL